ncbi:hypothetical protein B0J18DRAFT_108559 [Chaetomium sp. MPI-SDFR-AT-0129]|nr:hypothetical protein B0J18DRAFT_108559 [Chaetomium sp. MPI-SDFR-AT-0129]
MYHARRRTPPKLQVGFAQRQHVSYLLAPDLLRPSKGKRPQSQWHNHAPVFSAPLSRNPTLPPVHRSSRKLDTVIILYSEHSTLNNLKRPTSVGFHSSHGTNTKRFMAKRSHWAVLLSLLSISFYVSSASPPMLFHKRLLSACQMASSQASLDPSCLTNADTDFDNWLFAKPRPRQAS